MKLTVKVEREIEVDGNCCAREPECHFLQFTETDEPVCTAFIDGPDLADGPTFLKWSGHKILRCQACLNAEVVK